jgi:ribosomal protein S18 acetylase RimI-like enzyme
MAHTAIRNADPADYERVIDRVDAWWGGRQMASGLPRLFFTYFRPWTYVAERDGVLVGFLAGFQSQTDPAAAYCHYIGVDPETRGEGIGEALYQRLFADAMLRGCHAVFCVTSPVNRGSIAFHRRMGFEALPGDREADGMAYTADYDGPGEDRVRFRRTLSRSETGRA